MTTTSTTDPRPGSSGQRRPGTRSPRRLAAGLASGLAVVAIAALGACAPSPQSAGGISCQGGGGSMSATPGITMSPAPLTVALESPSPSGSCEDRSGAGIDGASVTALSVSFPSYECLVPSGTKGSGAATIVWSDGSSSELVLAVRMGTPVSGSVEYRVTAGAFEDMVGTATFSGSPIAGSCFDAAGVTQLWGWLDRIELTTVA